MDATAPPPQPTEEPVGEQPTSLGFLQLQDAFKRMIAVGVDVVDEQVRVEGRRGRETLDGVLRAAGRQRCTRFSKRRQLKQLHSTGFGC